MQAGTHPRGREPRRAEGGTGARPRPGKGRRGPYAPGVERRERLLAAVLRIVAREGLAGVTHRAVAAEAGTSLTATTYYFESKDAMIRAAFRHFAAWDLERIDQSAATLSRESLPVREAAALLGAIASEELRAPERSLAVDLEMILRVAREPSLAPDYEAFQRRLEERTEELLRAVGSAEPARDARIVLAFYRGYQIEQLARPVRRRSRQALEADVARLISALVAGSPGVCSDPADPV
ncbi:MAG: TetR/AcrR family transcriptional regulator [Myxococcota bacterium]